MHSSHSGLPICRSLTPLERNNRILALHKFYTDFIIANVFYDSKKYTNQATIADESAKESLKTMSQKGHKNCEDQNQDVGEERKKKYPGFTLKRGFCGSLGAMKPGCHCQT